jgi:hypothetical protein
MQPSMSGYYWWLPLCFIDEPNKAENWSIISYHPENPARQKSGQFIGPIPPPILLNPTKKE